MIERCLNCTLPSKCCYGEKECCAQSNMDRDAMYQSVRYGFKKGMSATQIAGALHVSETTVKNIINGRILKYDR